jgi:uncharacterized protein (DUF2236 family)
MRVERADLEARLAELARDVRDPRAGLFGPASRLWQVNRHAVLFAGAGRAALLQLAHPWVARAIEEHSAVARDPLGRFRRTFARVFAMLYGDLDAAFAAARAVHGVHAGIRGRLSEGSEAFAAGSAYDALDLDALRWVHATLCETSVFIHERYVGPLSLREKESYYLESRRFAALFGLPSDALPASWPAFEAYNREMWSSPVLRVSGAARSLGRGLFQPQQRALRPLFAAYERFSAQLLPEPIRHGYGFGEPTRGARLASALLSTGFHAQERAPRSLRYLPPYLDAQRRLGLDRLHVISRALDRAVFGRGRSPARSAARQRSLSP